MATDQATTFASPLASSSAMTLLFCALITLVAAYTLILFVKNVLSSFRSAKSGAGQQARFLCQNCSILYGKRAAEGEADLSGPVGGNKLTDYNYPGGRQTGWPSSNEQYVKCSECSVRVLRQQAAFNGRDNSSGNSSRSNKSDSSRFYGKNIVTSTAAGSTSDAAPGVRIEFDCSKSGRGDDGDNNENNDSDDDYHDDIGGQEDQVGRSSGRGLSDKKLAEDLRNFITRSSNSGQTQDSKTSDSTGKESASYNCSLQTVYELDANGHSSHQQENCDKNNNNNNNNSKSVNEIERVASERGKKESDRSKSSATGRLAAGEIVDQNEREAQGPQARWRRLFKASLVVNMFNEIIERRNRSLVPRVFRMSISSPLSSSSSSSHSSSSPANRRDGHDDDEPEFLNSRKLRSAEIQIPIEAFNDSNTSEFDDVPGCDSREDTSLDYMGSQLQHYQAAASKGAKGRAPAGQERASPDPESSGSAHSNSNEMVMDADLRQVNRLNLELALFQNAHTDHRPAGTAGHDLHHHAIGGFPGQQQQHHHHNHLPQSGILCAASEVGGPMATSGAQAARPVPVPVAAPRRAAKRQSSEDCDSGCQARDEPDDNGADDSSRRSSGIGTCGDRSISSASSTPTTVASSTALAASQLEGMASIRLEVRRLSGGDQSGASGRAAKKSATLGRDPSGSDNRDGAAPASGKRSLLYSLANTIGRSKSSESASSEQAASKADELGGSGDTRYEISLIEVRNIGGKQPGGPGGGAAPADTPPVERPRASSLRGRRDSLLNALMAAANNVGVGVGAGSGRGAHLTGGMSPNTQRRSPAIEGVFARVFKQQTGDAGSGSGAAGQQQPSASPGGDSSAISSGGGQRGARLSPSTSSASSGSQAAPDYIQLPLIKFDSGQQQHGLDSVNFELSAPNKSYRFTCRLSEFPVRLSLYQVSKRNGARYTLGHCIVTPADWQSVGADKQQDGAYDRHFWPANKFVHLPARLMGSSGTGTEFATISETNAHGSGESSADFGSQQERRRSSGQDKWALEYCLHRTILDAIKAS